MSRYLETIEIKKKRLLFRSTHRGTREMDILLGDFFKSNMSDLNKEQLNEFEGLIEIPDDDLYNWAMGRMEIPKEMNTQLLRNFVKSVQSRGAE